jgi:hypothetical protein
MKKYLLFVAAAFGTASLFAQEVKSKKVIFSVGAEAAVPVGDYNSVSSFAFGGTAQAEYLASNKVGITLNSGYINYFGKRFDLPGYGSLKRESFGQIPVLAGIRYYFIKDIYVSGQLGISQVTKGAGAGFTYAPGIGFKFSVLDATVKYMGVAFNGVTLSTVGVRVAYTF